MRLLCSGKRAALQIEMWERITAGLASLGDEAVQGDGAGSAPSGHTMDEQQLVDYEGMLVAASAAQRRRFVLAAPMYPLSNQWRWFGIRIA